MDKATGADLEALRALEAATVQYKAVATLYDELRAKRDFLIVAAVRRGISYRRVAVVAHIHPSRVQQLHDHAADAAETAGLQSVRPKKHAPGRKTRGRRSGGGDEATPTPPP